jgi:hypothetical protein
MKNESTRTISYLVAAAVAIGLAIVLSPPGEITPQQLLDLKVGTEFFKDFTNPNEATSILVVSYDEASATAREFAVNLQNGKWTIPTRHNYPADGQDRLAKTANSLVGIKREELASASKQFQEQLGVISPLDKDRTELKGRGQQLTLKKGEDTLVDLIIGKPVKDRPGFYYVRRPDEAATFVAKLDINLSTKFADWIETDLLKLNRDDLKEIVIDNYSIDKTQGALVKGDISTLERDKAADPWKLEGIDESKEEVDVTKVNGMITALDDLKIVGVRPKPKGFNPDLTLDREFVKNQNDVNKLRFDLQEKGFAFGPDKQTKQLRLYSDQGDLLASTNKGVTYTLRFGDVFLGDETEIEIGGASNKKDGDKKEGEEKKEGDEQDDKTKAKNSLGKQSSRYLFVTASFDEKFLGPRPEKPSPPEGLAAATETSSAKPKKGDAAEEPSTQNSPADKPNRENGATTPEKDAPEKKTPEKTPSDKSDENCTPAVAGDDEPEKGEEAKPGDADAKKDGVEGDAKKDEAKPDAAADPDKQAAPETKPEIKEGKKKSADDLQKEYKELVKKYDSDLKAYEDKVAAGKKQVDELNARFSGWYYVISADLFNKLHLTRKELVKEKTKPGDGKAAAPTDPLLDESDREKPDGDKPEDKEKEDDGKDPQEN